MRQVGLAHRSMPGFRPGGRPTFLRARASGSCASRWLQKGTPQQPQQAIAKPAGRLGPAAPHPPPEPAEERKALRPRAQHASSTDSAQLSERSVAKRVLREASRVEYRRAARCEAEGRADRGRLFAYFLVAQKVGRPPGRTPGWVSRAVQPLDANKGLAAKRPALRSRCAPSRCSGDGLPVFHRWHKKILKRQRRNLQQRRPLCGGFNDGKSRQQGGIRTPIHTSQLHEIAQRDRLNFLRVPRSSGQPAPGLGGISCKLPLLCRRHLSQK